MSDGCSCYAREKHGTFWIYVTTTAVCSAVARTPAKKIEKVERFSFQGLTFARHGDKLSVDSGSATNGERYSSSFQSYFSKRMCKPTKFRTISFDSEHEIPAGALYPDALLDVSLASRNRVLGRTCTFAHGESSGFFHAQISRC